MALPSRSNHSENQFTLSRPPLHPPCHQPQTLEQLVPRPRAQWESTCLPVQRWASLSSSSPRRWSMPSAVLASSSASLSLAFFTCSSCSRRRAFTWESPVLLDGPKPQQRDSGQVASPLKGSLRAQPYASWAWLTQLGCEGPQATPKRHRPPATGPPRLPKGCQYLSAPGALLRL